MAEDFSTQGMLEIYLYENGQLLERLQEIVLEQKDEECFDEDAINEIFRAMHTIKGSSGVMMFDEITKISHKLEDVFFFLCADCHDDYDGKDVAKSNQVESTVLKNRKSKATP